MMRRAWRKREVLSSGCIARPFEFTLDVERLLKSRMIMRLMRLTGVMMMMMMMLLALVLMLLLMLIVWIRMNRVII